MEITTELLKTIYDRAISYAIAKYGNEPDRIEINEDGSIEARWWAHDRYNEDDVETFSAENLTQDLDEVAKERADKWEQERIARINRQKIEDEQRAIRDKAQRKSQYLQLKKEFGDTE